MPPRPALLYLALLVAGGAAEQRPARPALPHASASAKIFQARTQPTARAEPPAVTLASSKKSSVSLHAASKKSSSVTLSAASRPSVTLCAASKKPLAPPPPSFFWALLSNWLYFLSLGFNAINMAFLVRKVVSGDLKASEASIALSGNIEAVDKMLTFLGVGYLSALSDMHGRRPLMAWSALGFAATNFIQASSDGSRASLYLADLIDGCSSCMTPVCQAYVVDCSPSDQTATNLGLFQGLSIGGAFIIAFPVGGVLGAKLGPRVPLLIAGGLQVLNALIITFLTPESHLPSRRSTAIDLRSANPLGALQRLFGQGAVLRGAAATYFLLSLARNSLDAQFVNYASVRFGWSQQQTGPVMVLVGLMLAVVPRLVVPLLGLRQSVLVGLLVFAFGLTATGLAPSPAGFVAGIAVVALGCVCLPALQAFLTSLADEDERGALLGALGSLTELTGAIGSSLYAAVLAHFSSPSASLPVPGMHFLVAAAMLLVAYGIGASTLPLSMAAVQQ